MSSNLALSSRWGLTICPGTLSQTINGEAPLFDACTLNVRSVDNFDSPI